MTEQANKTGVEESGVGNIDKGVTSRYYGDK